jgi:hypothetical protein
MIFYDHMGIKYSCGIDMIVSIFPGCSFDAVSPSFPAFQSPSFWVKKRHGILDMRCCGIARYGF